MSNFLSFSEDQVPRELPQPHGAAIQNFFPLVPDISICSPDAPILPQEKPRLSPPSTTSYKTWRKQQEEECAAKIFSVTAGLKPPLPSPPRPPPVPETATKKQVRFNQQPIMSKIDELKELPRPQERPKPPPTIGPEPPLFQKSLDLSICVPHPTPFNHIPQPSYPMNPFYASPSQPNPFQVAPYGFHPPPNPTEHLIKQLLDLYKQQQAQLMSIQSQIALMLSLKDDKAPETPESPPQTPTEDPPPAPAVEKVDSCTQVTIYEKTVSTKIHVATPTRCEQATNTSQSVHVAAPDRTFFDRLLGQVNQFLEPGPRPKMIDSDVSAASISMEESGDGGAMAATDKSMVLNEMTAKYLQEKELGRAQRKQVMSPIGDIDVSTTCYEYLKKYQLLDNVKGQEKIPPRFF